MGSAEVVTTRKNGGFNKWGVRLAKFVITVALLLLVSSQVDLDQLLSLSSEIDWTFLVLAIVITLAQTIILSWRWHRIVGFLGGALGVGLATRLSFLGVFMNQVLPTSIGGDVFRVWGLHRHGVASGIGLISVVIDRVTGLLALSVLVTFSTVLVWALLNDAIFRLVILFSSPAIVGLMSVCIIIDRYRFDFLNHHVSRLISELAAGMRKLVINPNHAAEVLMLGVLAQATGLIAAFVLGKGIGIEVDMFTSMALVGSVILLSALPVSLGGWGVREASMMTLFAIVGVSNEKSLLLSVLYGLVMMIASLPGGFVWWIGGARAYTNKPIVSGDETVEQVKTKQSVYLAYTFTGLLGSIKMGRAKSQMLGGILKWMPLDGRMGRWVYLTFLLGLVVSVVVIGPIIGGDAGSYENHWPTRSPIYPLILDIFCGHYSLLIGFQVVTGAMAILFFCRILQSILNLLPIILLTISFLLFIPYFPIGALSIANNVGTEAVSYSLFLISISFFMLGLADGGQKNIVVSCAVLLILILTRKQFLFVFPVYVLMMLFRQDRSKSLVLIGIVLMTFLGANAIERINNGITTGHYTGIPFTGIQAVIRPLWISGQEDADSFTGVEKEVFISTLQTMNKSIVSLDSCKKESLPIQCGYHHFLESYNIICWQILYPTLKQYGITDWWEIDKITLSISSKIIQKHFFSYLSEYYSAVKNGDGPYYMILLIVVLFWSMMDILKHDSIKSKIALMVTMMSLVNILMVSMVEPLLNRYTFYTSFLQIALLVVLISKRENFDVRNSR